MSPVIKLNAPSTNGAKYLEKVKINMIRMTKEYCSMNEIARAKCRGRRLKSIFDPSSGGIGTRLKKASARLIMTIEEMNPMSFSSGTLGMIKRNKSPKKRAINKLASTPAAATATVPHFSFLRFSGLYGTGRAHPKAKPVEKYRSAGKTTEPNKSKCAIGFKVRRPAMRAVLSPKYSAIKP